MQTSRGAEPRCPLTRLGPLLVRLFVRPEGPGREPRRDQCAHATACGGARRIGLEAGRGRAPSGAFLGCASTSRGRRKAGGRPRGRRRRPRAASRSLASGFEIGLVRDALLDRRLLGRALDAVSDLAREGRVPMSVSQRDLVRLPGSLESFSRVFANRLQHLEPVSCLDLHERLVHERLEPSSEGVSASAQTASTSPNAHPPAKRAMRRKSRCSGSVSSEWLQSIVARSVCCRPGLSRSLT